MTLDFTSAAWQHVAAWAREQLQAARERNDNTALSIEHTASLRGEIATLKKLLALPEEAARDQQSGSAQAHPIVWDEPSPGY